MSAKEKEKEKCSTMLSVLETLNIVHYVRVLVCYMNSQKYHLQILSLNG